MPIYVNRSIVGWALGVAAAALVVKIALHDVLQWEPVEQTSVHNALVASAIFVLGFVLAATISDYKESERIPGDFAVTVEDIYNDAAELQKAYAFDLEPLRRNLVALLGTFRHGTREGRRDSRLLLADLHTTFGQMNAAGVPPNYVTKIKQQEAVLMSQLARVNYIQRVQFIPSAMLLVRLITAAIIALLLLTEVDSFAGGALIVATFTFLLVYLQRLIQVVSVPFQDEGHTRDDVSLFLVREAAAYLESKAPGSAPGQADAHEDGTPRSEEPLA
jgi:hypothetical protein